MLQINPEFKKLIPALTSEEFQQLEANCLAEGIRDAIVVWNGFIIDGHNRYEIANKHGLQYRTVEKHFESETDAKIWMIYNQFGRRNLNAWQRSVLALELEEVFKEKAKDKQAGGQGGSLLVQISAQAKLDDIEKKYKEEYDKIWGDKSFTYDVKVRLTDDLKLRTGKERRRVFNEGKTLLYVAKTSHKIKVGVSKDPYSRLDVLRTSDPDIELVDTFENGIEIEKLVLSKFSEFSIGGEWFRYSDELLLSILSYSKNMSEMENKTRNKLAKAANVSHDTIAKVKVIEAKATPEVKAQLSAGDMSINQAYKEIKQEEKQSIVAAERKAKEAAGRLITNLDIDFRLGDFETVFSDIQDGSIDCIITDPPYPKEFLECWTKLARFAKRVLKPNGFCIAYSGHIYLDNVMSRMCEHLDYYWIFSMYQPGATQIVHPRSIMAAWKPILIYQNGLSKNNKVIRDYFISEQREKTGHDWQQSLSGVNYLIEMFTNEGDLICEPFAGSGTTIVAAKQMNRKVIASEIDETTYNIAKSNL